MLNQKGAEELLGPYKGRPMTSSGVNPEMIRLARVSRGMHQTQVAEALGVQQPAYSKMETGGITVSDEHLQKLAQILRYPTSFFSQTERIWGTASPHHRRRRSLSFHQLNRLEAELNIVRLNLRQLMQSVEIDPLLELPTIDLDEVGKPGEAARQLRRLWRQPSGPISNVTRLLEDAGVFIVEWPYPNEKVDAISVWGPGEPPVVLINATFPPDRKRLTSSHELAHLVIHAADVTDNPEAEANQFASEFLMPEADIRHELRNLRLRDLPDLKRRWKVAMRALIYRAQQLGEIEKDQARYMFIRLTKEYGAKREPINLPEESPTLLSELLGRHLGELGYSEDQLAATLHREAEDFIHAYGLRQRHLRAL